MAFSFSQPSYIWRHSNLGYKTRCLLVCEVDMDKVEPAEEAEKGAAQGAGEAAGSAGSAAAGSSSDPHGPAGGQVQKGLPESYLLVKRGDAIRLLYVLICECVRGDAVRPGVRKVPGVWGRRYQGCRHSFGSALGWHVRLTGYNARDTPNQIPMS